jgi:hypothetical protein
MLCSRCAFVTSIQGVFVSFTEIGNVVISNELITRYVRRIVMWHQPTSWRPSSTRSSAASGSCSRPIKQGLGNID